MIQLMITVTQILEKSKRNLFMLRKLYIIYTDCKDEINDKDKFDKI